LVVIEPPHHRPPPQRIASGQQSLFTETINTFATKSATSRLMHCSKMTAEIGRLIR
jgi:hypothetical protein